MGVINQTIDFIGRDDDHKTEDDAHDCRDCRGRAIQYLFEQWDKQPKFVKEWTLERLWEEDETELIALIKAGVKGKRK